MCIYLDNKSNKNYFRTDLVINQRSTESMYSVEGLKFLHQDSHVVMLPKGLPSIGHNVSREDLIYINVFTDVNYIMFNFNM